MVVMGGLWGGGYQAWLRGGVHGVTSSHWQGHVHGLHGLVVLLHGVLEVEVTLFDEKYRDTDLYKVISNFTLIECCTYIY